MASATPTATARFSSGPPAGLGRRISEAAGRPVAADSLALFRILFGLLVAAGSLRFLAMGWVDRLYLEPANHLTHAGFDWVRPLPGPWMHLLLLALAVLGICIAIGYRQRAAAGIFALGFAYTELIDAALYLNHYWLVTLLAVLLLLLPADRHWSLDAWSGRVEAAPCIPAGVIWLLRSQIAAVYLFAGLAKLNPDWLLQAQPLGLWLPDRSHLPLVGPFLEQPAAAHMASWGGAFFDCTIVGWLLWRRTRLLAYCAVAGFHLATGVLFQIGIFPWLMAASALLFFAPDWPTRLLARLGRRPLPAAAGAGDDRSARQGPVANLSGPVLAALTVLVAAQLLLPLRHYAYPGNVRWTEEGYYLAWRVLLTEKSGLMDFRVTDPDSGRTWTAGPELVLSEWQIEQAATRPGLIQKTAYLLEEHYRRSGAADVEVRADAWVSMNGSRAQRIVDPEIDLTARPRSLLPADWILPRGPD